MYYFFLTFTCAVVTLTCVNSNQRPIETGIEYISNKRATPNHKRVYDLKRLKNIEDDTRFTDGELKLRLSNLLKVSQRINIPCWDREKNYSASALSITSPLCVSPQHIALYQNLPLFLAPESYLCAWDSSTL